MKKLKAALLLLACCLLMAVPFRASAAVKKGWDATKTSYYVKKDGKLVKATGLTKIGSDYYYFDRYGVVVKNKWGKSLKDGSHRYTFYFGKNGKAYKAPSNEYFSSTAVKKIKIDGKYYAFDEDAHMVTGFAVATDGKLYYFDSKGVYNSSKTQKGRSMAKIGKTSKTMLNDVVKVFGKPVKKEKSDSCNFFDQTAADGAPEGVTYSGYLYTYKRFEISITRNDKTKICHMDGPSAIIQ